MQNSSGPTVGDGYNFTEFNRGGMIAAIAKSALLEVYNGPLDIALVAAITYVVGNIIYWNPTSATFTNVTAGAVQVGILEDYLTNSTGVVVRLKIRLTL
jgi:hypothetical protein